MSKTATNEFFVRYVSQFEDYQAILAKSCKTWNSVAKNQLRRKLKHHVDIWENEDKKVKYFSVNFQNGSNAHFLFIPETLTMFEVHEQIREAFMEHLKEHENISINLYKLDLSLQKSLIVAFSSAIALYQWVPPKYGKKATKNKKETKNFGFYCDIPTSISSLIIKGQTIAEGTNLVRTLCMTPTNYMTSKDLVTVAKKIGKKLRGVKVDFIDEKQLKEWGAGAFLSVIQGTKGSDGGIVHLKYRTRAKDKPTVAIVGKGVVFDTGGYDIKTESSMEGMHRDMTGAAVALALFQSLVKSNVKVNLDLYMAIGENLVSEVAYKPNDVVTAMDGTSIEIINTDAEGRMLLADTMIYANSLSPDLMIDFGTLTGTIMDSLDTRYAGIFPNQDYLGLIGMEAGKDSGERVWAFPMTSDFKEGLDSEIADIRQCQTSDLADHIYAACFIGHWAKKTPWMHIDLGCETNDGGLGLVDTEVNGFGVRWGFEFIQHFLKIQEE